MGNYNKLTAYLDGLYKNGVPACGIQVYRGHEKIYEHFCGFSDAGKTVPIDGNTLFYYYSCTKPVTAVAGMILVEKGLLRLDAPVADYLPSFRNVFVEDGGKRRDPKTVMTVRHLFTMSAGFDYSFDAEPLRGAIARSGGKAFTRELVDAMTLSPLIFEPGEKFYYSRCHDVLAAVIEAASGKKFSDFVRENVFEPVGMKNSYFSLRQAELDARMAEQYRYDEKRRLVKIPKQNSFKISEGYESGGAGLISCIRDGALFADMMACGGVAADGVRVIGENTLREMTRDQLTGFLRDPEFCSVVGPGYTYGLGLRTLSDRSFGLDAPVGEFGWDGAAAACMTSDPVNRIGIFYAQHTLNWPDGVGCDVHIKMRNCFYGDYAEI